MFDIATVTTFLGWCTVINIGFLMFSTLFVAFLNEWIINLHSKMFGLEKAELPMMYFKYLGNYKILIIAFNLVPYIALNIMS